MIKIYTREFFFFCLFLQVFNLSAQKHLQEAAINHLKRDAEKLDMSERDLNEMTVRDSYISPTTGWYHIYFNQNYKGIEVLNGIIGVTLKDGYLVSTANNFVPRIDLQVNSASGLNQISANDALKRAIESVGMKGSLVDEAKAINSKANIRGVVTQKIYEQKEIAKDSIKVTLVWFKNEKEDEENKKSDPQVSLVWNVAFLSKDLQNAWNIQVDAQDGRIISTKDEVIKCEFGHPNHPRPKTNEVLEGKASNESLLANNSYKVFNIPVESPIHGSRTEVVSPYMVFAPSGGWPGSTNGWHHDGSTSFTDTRGNNVYAQEDTDYNDTGGSRPSSTTRTFDFTYSQGIGTATTNQNAAITNLFYWNNLLHDVLWKYGFDEVSGNFQANNMSRGGLGNDFVYADAQDGSDSGNANFYTPADGGNGRMQMYLWYNPTSYDADSDFDNGVISHEYGHGWSVRLSGGPSSTTCLWNTEQGGEGWGDYLGLMLTTDWAALSPNLASANLRRSIGTYVLGESTSGGGIRPYPYTYDMTVNGAVTYGAVSNTSFSIPHGIGSIWCTMLWDMTWEIIMEDNFLADNIYDLSDMRGNVAALKLVNEGLRLQPCNPSFVAAKNAILQADQALFGGRYNCAINKAFARRGLGEYASTGSSSDDRVVYEDFTPSGNLLSSSTEEDICTGSAFSYTATCSTPGVSFSWTRAAVTGISNPASSGSSATINETLINTTSSPIVVTYVFTLSPAGCGTAGTINRSLTLTVNPYPPTPAVGTYSICQNLTVPVGEGLKMFSTGLISEISSSLTSSDPKYTRYLGSSSNYYYKVFPFTPSTSGNVTFEITSGTFDTYLFLYTGSFNASAPSTNLTVYDDDSGDGLLSKFIANVNAGTTYYVVVSSYNTLSTGNFTLNTSINGLGDTFRWYTSATSTSPIYVGNVFNPVGVSGSGIPNTLTPISKTYYVAYSQSPECRIATTFNVTPATVVSTPSGVVSANDTLCAIFNDGTLTLSGHIGSILGWEVSEDNFTTWTTISSTSTTFNYSGLVNTTSYRVLQSHSSCQVLKSSPATIKIISPELNLMGNVNSGSKTEIAGFYIDSEEEISPPARVHYKAGRNIELHPGFESNSSTVFLAEIVENECYVPVVLTLQPDASNSKDTDISDVFSTVNYKSSPYLVPYAWTQFSQPEVRRSLIEFDLSSIPVDAVVDSAFLSFSYSSRFVTENPPFTGHFGSNSLLIKRISQAWADNTVTWANQPSNVTVNAVSVASATAINQNYKNINVKDLVSDCIVNGNYGFMISHQAETPYKLTCLASSEEEDASLRPKLVVFYRYK